jgi:hypothetical protein
MRVTPSHRVQRRPHPQGHLTRWCRRKNWRWRRPARIQQLKNAPGRALIRWATLGRTRGLDRPLLGPAIPPQVGN